MTLNIKMINTTTGRDVDLGVPEETILRDVFSQLVEAELLTAGVAYSAVNKTQDMKPLVNDKSIKENGVKDNDTLLITNATPA